MATSWATCIVESELETTSLYGGVSIHFSIQSFGFGYDNIMTSRVGKSALRHKKN